MTSFRLIGFSPKSAVKLSAMLCQTGFVCMKILKFENEKSLGKTLILLQLALKVLKICLCQKQDPSLKDVHLD